MVARPNIVNNLKYNLAMLFVDRYGKHGLAGRLKFIDYAYSRGLIVSLATVYRDCAQTFDDGCIDAFRLQLYASFFETSIENLKRSKA